MVFVFIFRDKKNLIIFVDSWVTLETVDTDELIFRSHDVLFHI